jgi:hypothetical protein
MNIPGTPPATFENLEGQKNPTKNKQGKSKN